MQALEPDLATVASLFTSPFLVTPTSESSIVMVELGLSRIIYFLDLPSASEEAGGPTKNFFVGVEGVDDQAHQLLNVGVESDCLRDGSTEPQTMRR